MNSTPGNEVVIERRPWVEPLIESLDVNETANQWGVGSDGSTPSDSAS